MARSPKRNWHSDRIVSCSDLELFARGFKHVYSSPLLMLSNLFTNEHTLSSSVTRQSHAVLAARPLVYTIHALSSDHTRIRQNPPPFPHRPTVQTSSSSLASSWLTPPSARVGKMEKAVSLMMHRLLPHSEGFQRAYHFQNKVITDYWKELEVRPTSAKVSTGA